MRTGTIYIRCLDCDKLTFETRERKCRECGHEPKCQICEILVDPGEESLVYPEVHGGCEAEMREWERADA